MGIIMNALNELNGGEPMNKEPEMAGGEEQIEQMANLNGGKRTRKTQKKQQKRQQKKSQKRQQKKSQKQQKKQQKKRGGSLKSGLNVAAAPLVLLGMQQVLAKKLGKNKKSRRNTRRNKKN